jgi:Gluconate 2-dehydrogenase subunit 3
MRPPVELLQRLRLTRRDLLRALAALAAFLPAPLLLAATPTATDHPDSLRALGPFLDTLLPEDETPGATQLGVDRLIVESMRERSQLARVIALCCAWLDQQARERGAAEFAQLDEAARISIITAAEQSAPSSLPHVFFAATRQLAFHEYYAQPAAWRGMPDAHTPQPEGFSGHDRRPAAPSR